MTKYKIGLSAILLGVVSTLGMSIISAQAVQASFKTDNPYYYPYGNYSTPYNAHWYYWDLEKLRTQVYYCRNRY